MQNAQKNKNLRHCDRSCVAGSSQHKIRAERVATEVAR